MRTLVVQTVVLLNALLLTLPPGWCQAVSGGCRIERAGEHGIAEQLPAARSCCQQKRAATSKPAEAPQLPGVRCCCDRDSAPPPERAQLPDDSGLALPAIVDDATAHSAPQVVGRFSNLAEHHVGPPLRILQCVWRC